MTNLQETLTFIGNIATPYHSTEACPCNISSDGPLCEITLYDEFSQGLQGLCKGDDILILYWLAEADRNQVEQYSSRQNALIGTFALRSPHRPNPIGAAVLTIEEMYDATILIRGIDCLNNTQLIDIKPAILKEILTNSEK